MIRKYPKLLFLVALILPLLICVHCGSQPNPTTSLVNFSHLEHLTQEIEFNGETVHIVHIYSEYPDYAWRAAAESGPEGISCVDDVARAAVVYLRNFELTSDRTSLDRARLLLKFVLEMQTDDGQFYNFIFPDHSINVDGITSYKSFGWWAVRGVWAFGMGYRIFKDNDPRFAEELKAAVERTFPQIEKVLGRYGEFEKIYGRSVPAWLIYQYDTYSASTVSELLLGLCEYYKANPDPKVADYIIKFSEAFLMLQEGDVRTPPYGAFLSTPKHWHAWANGQVQALATAGKLLNRPDFIEAAEKEVRLLYPRLVVNRMIREIHFNDDVTVKEFPQIAYCMRPMIVGALRLADATGNYDYEKLAGILASWFFGNNVAGKTMYDVSTGRCYDGIVDSTTVNLNSGAESTIEALYSILEVEHRENARKFLFLRKIEQGGNDDYIYALFKTEEDIEVAVVLMLKESRFSVLEEEKIYEFFLIKEKS